MMSQQGCGCLVLLVVAVLGSLLVTCTAPSSDCYATPGALEGSAQHQRDVERCLEP